MITDTALQWITTALFGFCAVHCVGLLRSHRQPVHLIDHTAHLLMAVFMIVMVWPWGSVVPLAPQAVIFTAATAWFAWTAVRIVRRPFAETDGPDHGVAARAYHAVMMASMVWMIAVMAGWVGGAAHSSSTGGHESMPGMDMSGISDMSAPASPWWVDTTTMLTVAVFVTATVLWIFRAFAAEQSSTRQRSTRQRSTRQRETAQQDTSTTRTLTRTTIIGVAPATLGAMSEVAMAAGMAIMMGALL